jgi:DNA recombination protein RmuC
MQKNNENKLEQIRLTVDEKLNETLTKRLDSSFKAVSEQLENVYKSLGEMKVLSSGVTENVTSLNRILTNVKARGTWAEVQLEGLLNETIPGMFEKNYMPNPLSRSIVEFAVRIPSGEDKDSVTYLPIDSKFPGDAYMELLDAYDTGDRSMILSATDHLRRAVIKSAKDIRSKYIYPPYTTEFAIMFLPFEGLYAEVLRLDLVEQLQRDYRVSVAGPTTMAAILNSFQLGFRSLALQQSSGEVWDTLDKVRTEFEKFDTVLEDTQHRLDQAQKDLEALVGVRTRSIRRALDKVSDYTDEQ